MNKIVLYIIIIIIIFAVLYFGTKKKIFNRVADIKPLNTQNSISNKNQESEPKIKINSTEITFDDLVQEGQMQKLKLKPAIKNIELYRNYIKDVINDIVISNPELLSEEINCLQLNTGDSVNIENKLILVLNTNKIETTDLNNEEILNMKELVKLYRDYDYNVTYLKTYLEESHRQLNEYQLNYLNFLEDRNISPQQGKYYSNRFTHNNFNYIGDQSTAMKYINDDLEFILSCPDFIQKQYVVKVDNYIGIIVTELIKPEYNDILSLILSDLIINFNYYNEFIDENEKYNLNKMFGGKNN